MTVTDDPPTPAPEPDPVEAIKAPAPTPSTDVALAAPDLGRGVLASTSIDARIRYARELAEAGLLPGEFRGNPGNVLYAVEFGNMLGIHPLAAITGVHVMDGKPTASPALMSALVRRAGHKLRVTVTGTVERGDLAATATLIRSDDPDHPYVATWTIKRALRAGLVDSYVADVQTGEYVVRSRTPKGKPSSWEKFPEAMCKARAIGEVCREGAEEALCGVHYTPEELGVQVDADGVVIVETTLAEPETPAETPEERVTRLAGLLLPRIAAARSLDELSTVYRQTAALPEAAALAVAQVNYRGESVTIREAFAYRGRELRDGPDDPPSAAEPDPEPPAPPAAPEPASDAQERPDPTSGDADQLARPEAYGLAPADPWAQPPPDPAAHPLDGTPTAPVLVAYDVERVQRRDDPAALAAWSRFGRRTPYVGAGPYGALASAQLDDEALADLPADADGDREAAYRASVAAWLLQADLDERVDAEPVSSADIARARPRAAIARRTYGL